MNIKSWFSIDWCKTWSFLKAKLLIPICTFIKNVPETLGESILWLIFTFFLPAAQVFLKYILTGSFELSKDTMCIFLVAIVSLYVSINMLNLSNRKKRKVVLAFSIIGYGVSSFLFSILKAETIKETTLIYSDKTVTISVVSLFFLSVLLALISKYDEVSANSRRIAEQGKDKKEAQIGKEKFNIE